MINLLLELQREMNLALLFIAHDLAVVKHVSDHIAVMYLGEIIETATATEIYQSPRHPYTQALLSAIPVPDPDSQQPVTASFWKATYHRPLNHLAAAVSILVAATPKRTVGNSNLH